MPKNYNQDFMSLALKNAEIAFSKNEVPVGAVIVKDGIVLGHGSNSVIERSSVLYHAEINAINQASARIQNYRLNGCDIYVTLEPCHMCAKAIVDARISNLYYGALEPKTGAIESIDKFLSRHHLNHKVSCSGGYMANRSKLLLKNFFKARRN